jgi:hypothetical protein
MGQVDTKQELGHVSLPTFVCSVARGCFFVPAGVLDGGPHGARLTPRDICSVLIEATQGAPLDADIAPQPCIRSVRSGSQP